MSDICPFYVCRAVKLWASDQQRSAHWFGAPNPGSLAVVIDVVSQCLTSPFSPTVLPSQSIYLTTNVDPSCSFMPLFFLPLLLVTRLPPPFPRLLSVRALFLLFTFSVFFFHARFVLRCCSSFLLPVPPHFRLSYLSQTAVALVFIIFAL